MWQVGLQVDDELDVVMASSSDAVSRVVDVGDNHEAPCLTMDSAVQLLWTASKRRLHGSLCTQRRMRLRRTASRDRTDSRQASSRHR
jgi:hypothetical protein